MSDKTRDREGASAPSRMERKPENRLVKKPENRLVKPGENRKEDPED